MRRLGGLDLELLEAMFDPQPDAPMFVKDAGLRYVAANLAMLRLCGVRRREALLGRTAGAVFSAPLAARYEALDRSVIARGEPRSYRLDLSLDASGAPTWLLFSRLPVRDEEGRVVGVAATSRRLGPPDPRHPTYARLAAVVARLEADPSAPLALRDLARLAAVSVSQLERDFVATFGTTPRGYLARLRIERALDLLRGDGAVAAVAQACGYADQSAFARRFQAVTGASPSAFRAQLRRLAGEGG